ncbi:hypothetical protein K469DRAFT_687781 [Zopfia rhizophila CBS 207.26]|uniref:Uncharacterized protein n=1 Tax=Zopfia rhizophila CBS 207.26 TaxID=1314779 RepID=A0A6A6E6B6_9PEZI|nr:hypothetical protein K469DRAFT_687781 [Zopfia rhizophila CBS 207.26]
MPRIDFNVALLRQPDPNATKRFRPYDTNILLPSWSWTSFQGKIEYSVDPLELVCTLIKWYEYDGASLSGWKSIELQHIGPSREGHQLLVVLAWRYGCFEGKPSFCQTDFQSSAAFRSGWFFHEHTTPLKEKLSDHFMQAPLGSVPNGKPGALLFRAQIAQFRVFGPSHYSRAEEIESECEDIVGFISQINKASTEELFGSVNNNSINSENHNDRAVDNDIYNYFHGQNQRFPENLVGITTSQAYADSTVADFIVLSTLRTPRSTKSIRCHSTPSSPAILQNIKRKMS